ncbi:MAG: type II secretion system protein [Phycisphaeraceae bacterium]
MCATSARPADVRPAPARRGMTLIEILVVVSIMVVLALLASPVLNQIRRLSQGDAGVMTVQSAVTAARTLNHRHAQREMSDAGGQFEYVPHRVRHVGTAVLFTPAGEMRLVIHDPLAYDDHPVLGFLQEPADDSQPVRYGFKDIPDLDYLTFPRSTGVAGIVRHGPGHEDVWIVPPPFALRFDERGQLVSPTVPYPDPLGPLEDWDPDAFVLYSVVQRPGFASQANPYRWAITPNNTPTGPGFRNPDDSDPRVDGQNVALDADDRYELPFYAIPVVSGVVLFHAGDFRDAGGWNMDQASIYDWLLYFDLSNPNAPAEPRGRPIYFSPLTGTAMPRRPHTQ